MSPTTLLQIAILAEHVDLQWLPPRLLDDAYGKCLVENREIQLRSSMTGLQCLDCLIHEINHYISERCNLELSEHQVHVMAMAWSEIFQSNPEMLGWIAERTEEEDARRITTTRFNTPTG